MDQIYQDNIEIKYCPTKLMIGDFFTKPLQDKHFLYFRDLILGKLSVSSTDIDDRSVLEGVPLKDRHSGPWQPNNNISVFVVNRL
jgi:hypothetical protein